MKKIAVASLAILLAGCAQLGQQRSVSVPPPPPPQLTQADPAYIQASLDRVKQSLKDPDQARFSNIYATIFDSEQKEDPNVCGTVNAKNSYGGYAGDMRFVVTPGYPEGTDPFIFWDDRSSGVVRQFCNVAN